MRLTGIPTRAVLALAATLALACAKPPAETGSSKVDLSPHTTLPLYQITIEDPDEAALIAQQLKVNPVLVDQHAMYFTDTLDAAAKLKAAGYEPRRVSASDVEERIVRVPTHGTEAELLGTGVTLINREKDYWIVSGTLAQLRLLPRLGYTIEPLGAEPRPREVRVLVPTAADIQAVAELNVDIYSTMRTKDSKDGITIFGGATDAQIDAMQKAGYTVDRVQNPPPQ